MKAGPVYQNYINGEWRSVQGESEKVINPANEKVLAEVNLSSPSDVDEAVNAAKRAQLFWKTVPAPEKGELLFEISQKLREQKEELSQILTAENGKPIQEARGEVQEAIDMGFYMAGEGRRLFGQTVPAELPNKHAMSIRSPVGIAGLITPWNFPIAIASWKMFPAIISGNTVVWKPAIETPGMADAFVRILDECGLPAGVVNLVHGAGETVGSAIVEHDQIDIVSFTGSTKTGRLIASKAGSMLKKVSLEMGGKNAITVMDSADIDLAVDGILWSSFGTSGQRCTAASRIIVHQDIKTELEKVLIKRTKELTIGDGVKEDTDVGPVISRQALESIHEYVKMGRKEGELLCGGRIISGGQQGKGNYYEPTIITNVQPSARIAQEEVFGPVIAIIPVESFDEAMRVNNDSAYGLSSSIFTKDANEVFRAMHEMDTGIVYVNAGTTGAEIHLPFGGTKKTGNGHRDSGTASLDVFTEWKSVYVDYSGKLQRAQIDNN
ncbi:aldehyde dehydrogenase family protein [Alteribacillus bidgolensis]|uniref:3-sulfolactaldehyde dehydrogenase n=1 Tax=Alteribacillus bidgolensis TaxID=930129 RepID=A0A1G8KZ39_9BACI|nr:aldehyde dehydrogenase family protein [Alteribacillus bidgolensis]SDI48728.1 aldehyde dehydrogenase (NAD+) [Alteribacillus bidgolensis]